jgi:copper resistance protein C
MLPRRVARGVLVALLSLPLAAAVSRHLKLVRSEPAANSRVSGAPAAIRLWFSQPTQLAVTKVSLVPATGSAVVLSGLTQTNAGAPVVAPVGAPLAPGTWRIRWRTVARDGHPIKGEIPFTVAPAPTP